MENERVEIVQWEAQRSLDPAPWRPPQSEVKRELLSSIGLFIGKGLLGFWFEIGAALGNKMVNSLEELISR